MRYSFVLAAATAVFGAEMAKDEARAAELYDSGKIHEQLMMKKIVSLPLAGQQRRFNSPWSRWF